MDGLQHNVDKRLDLTV